MKDYKIANNGGVKIKSPIKTYEKRKKVYHDLLQKQTRMINKISNIRLFIAIIGIIQIIFLYMMESDPYIYYIAFINIAVFSFVVIKHNKLKHNNKYFHAFYKINACALERIKGHWCSFKDTGLAFKDDHHPFSSDLDIFGQGSLFQYVNTTTTNMGRQRLKKDLTNPCKRKEEINQRQKAVNELAAKLSWRQRLMAEGIIRRDQSDSNELLYAFFETKYEIYTKSWLIVGARLIPVVSIGLILLTIFGIIPYQIVILLFLIQIFLLLFKFDQRSKNLNLVYKYEDNIKVYSKLLEQIERKKFKSEYLLELKAKLTDDANRTACQQIKELEKITEKISYRKNLYFILINIVTLWDFQCVIALENWKEKSGTLIRVWLDTIGEFESLSSLATIRYDNPDWVTPKITDQCHVRAMDMGHPLITNDRVNNDFKLDDSTKVLLITGSNMSGKSTYLRTIGINMVLAYAGAPVCAKDFYCNIFNIYTCMRISDNLEQNISSFYAELLRIKTIVDASKTNKVFFLLDEVFKGTNSYDRHEGAKNLIIKLMNNEAIGLVSTHDLELGILEEESNKKIKNYHFKEYYKNNEIFFDYRLNPGISKTRNAMYLMKIIGIND